MGVEITQYRSRIGTFSRKNLTCNIGKVSLANKLKTNNLTESFVMLAYLLVLSKITQELLIISGVEMNPGPSTLGKNNLMQI